MRGNLRQPVVLSRPSRGRLPTATRGRRAAPSSLAVPFGPHRGLIGALAQERLPGHDVICNSPTRARPAGAPGGVDTAWWPRDVLHTPTLVYCVVTATLVRPRMTPASENTTKIRS